MDLSIGLLLTSSGLAFLAIVMGVISLKRGRRSSWTFLFMLASFISQCAFLYVRGELRGECPLGDLGEICVFISWSLSIFYMVIGSAYRVSLLGFFSTPFVVVLCGVAAIPGMMEVAPERVSKESIDAWGELHAALSVLAYGALVLGVIASAMFLVLDKRLKDHDFSGGLFKNLPPVYTLTALSKRLTWVGLGILTGGILSSFGMVHFTFDSPHLWVAIGVWTAYLAFLLWAQFRGMTPRAFAKICALLFFASLVPFVLI